MISQTVPSIGSKHKLIVVEGIDGTGKTTVAHRLARVIGGKYIRTPPPPFDSARQYVDKQGSLDTRFLFYLCSVSYASDVIRRELAKRDVVCDRYLGSTIAYHRALGIRLDWNMEELTLVAPDYAFLLEVSDESERMKRIRRRRRITAGDRLLEDEQLRKRMVSEFERFQWIKVDTAKRNADEVVEWIRGALKG
jgi:dTMP kinase